MQVGVSIYYAYIGLTDANSSSFVWLDGSAVAYSNLSGKRLPLSVSITLCHTPGMLPYIFFYVQLPITEKAVWSNADTRQMQSRRPVWYASHQ